MFTVTENVLLSAKPMFAANSSTEAISVTKPSSKAAFAPFPSYFYKSIIVFGESPNFSGGIFLFAAISEVYLFHKSSNMDFKFVLTF